MTQPRKDLVTFIEDLGFSEDWKSLKLDNTALYELQEEIIRNPQAAPIIAGTGGLRKLRFSPSAWNRGKSGSLRIC